MIYKWDAEKSTDETISTKIVGYINIEIPKSQERMMLLKEVNIKFEDGRAVFNLDHIDTMIKISQMVRERVKEIHLTVNGTEINDFDTIEYYSFYQTIVNELSSILFSGIPLGN